MLDGAAFRVIDIESKPQKRHPQPPFTTSTLQQEASRKLGFSATHTMRVAQRLYEGVNLGGETVGLITYMRTDGVQIAPEAVRATRDAILSRFGGRYLPDVPRHYSTKAKNAQEAHEAIRPTELGRHPDEVRRMLEPDEARLYELVWKRTVASQMESAELERTTIDVEARNGGRVAVLRATGAVIRFDGFLTLYQEGKDDEEDEEGRRLPAVAPNEALQRRAVEASQHFTEPPPRYTEATLIKKMEELGIGRPSTYTSTLAVLRDRGYVTLEKKRLLPEDKGRLVTAFLESFFDTYVGYDFTASLEEQLDRISNGELSWKDVLRDFWKAFSASVDDIKELRVADVLEALNEMLSEHIFPTPETGDDPRVCPSCGSGRLSLKIGRYGSFVGCSNYPECRYTRQLANGEGDGQAAAEEGDKALGEDPETGLAVTLRQGRFGPYVQLGEGEKPKRASLPRGWEPATIDLDRALSLLSLPREVGLHPETGKMITAGIGRYGPFVLHDGTFANLDSVEEVFTVGLNRAVAAIAEKQSKGSRGRGTPAALKSLGEHPELGGEITVRDGRYGPYVNCGKVNATLPKGLEPAAVTLEQAMQFIAAKQERDGIKPKAGKAAAKTKITGKTATKAKAPAKPKAKSKAAK